jgi:hypothetical protein
MYSKIQNDYRPVALTSIVMKCFERIVLRKLLIQTRHALDPQQFAYKHNRSTDDATLTILNNTYTHLKKPNSFVRILFVDFSSAFNTIQPHLMALKLSGLGVHPKLILWFVSFLVDRLQSVRYDRMLSDSRSTSTGSPQGTVLSPFCSLSTPTTVLVLKLPLLSNIQMTLPYKIFLTLTRPICRKLTNSLHGVKTTIWIST